MPIPFNKYVSITSSVGGNSGVGQRELILRIFTTNSLVPIGTIVEFTAAADVLAFFGSASEEYMRALFYFSWISKQFRSPGKISFSRWASAATAPLIFGKVNTYALATFTAIGAGTFSLTLGANTATVSVNFGADGSLAAVAATLQAAIRTAGSADGALWTAATVTFDPTRGCFDFTGGATGVAVISAVDGAETPLAALGWLPSGVGPSFATYSQGVAVETITATLTNSAQTSNNFGSFLFTTAAALNLSQVEEAAAWNQSQNVDYQFTPGVIAANASVWSAALIATAGTELTLVDPTDFPNEYDEQEPAMILAATDYLSRNASQNYMYQAFPGLTPKVTDALTSNTYDNLRVNYYGSTQTAGVVLAFYQRGVMMGGTTAPLDMNVYANEQWFKDAAAAALMNLLLGSTRVPVNNQGRAMILGALNPVIQLATVNDTISAGKQLTAQQIGVITSITGDNNAWRQVQVIGYWVEVTFASFVTEDARTEWKAAYTLIYSKDDLVRKIEGTHVLI